MYLAVTSNISDNIERVERLADIKADSYLE